MANVGNVTVTFGADTSQFNTGLTQVKRGLEGVDPVLNKVRGALQNVAFAAAGIPGPLGRVASILLNFTGGSALAAGVVVGIGAMAVAYNALANSINNVTGATTRLTIAQGSAVATISPIAPTSGGGLGAASGLMAPIDAPDFLLKGMEASEEQRLKEAEDYLSTFWRKLNQRVSREGFLERGAGETGAPSLMGRMIFNPKTEKDIVASMQKFFSGSAKWQAALKDVESTSVSQFGAIGVAIGDTMVAGILSAFRGGKFNFGSLIKGLLSTGISFAAHAGLTALFAPGAAVGPSVGAFAGSAIVDVAGLPAPVTPFDVIRDSQWISILSRSMSVAKERGYR